MTYLYLFLDLASISIPFLFSFHPKFKFYKYWKSLFPAIFLTTVIFIVWDIIFTHSGIWGFNEAYFLKTRIWGLPIEEWLFFICIPYACVFTHYALLYYFPKLKLTPSLMRYLSMFLIVVLLITATINYNKWYTLVNFLYAIFLISLASKKNEILLQNYYVTFMVMLIPFFIVNGILTGSFINNEVVWYNNQENLGYRLFTIPIEDIIYAFSLVLTNLMLTEYFQKKSFSTN